MELLWHFAARYCPQGDIGKFTDEQIASACDFVETKNTSIQKLMDSLVLAKWLDRNEKCRLLIHGWSEHADEAVNKFLLRNGLTYADGAKPRGTKSRHVETSQDISRRKTENGGQVFPAIAIANCHSQLPSKWVGDFWTSLRGTGKVDGLEVEDVLRIVTGYPEAKLAENWEEIVAELRASVGVKSNPDAWLRSACSRLEMRVLKGQKKETREDETARAPYVPLADRGDEE